jgi:hypothetical protein
VLTFFLDEHISPRIARQVLRTRPAARVFTVLEWQAGCLAGLPDDELLLEAQARAFTLVTYDCATVAPIVRAWMEQGIDHAGVIFVDERTIAPNDFGGLTKALVRLWDAEHEEDGSNRCIFLARAKRG